MELIIEIIFLLLVIAIFIISIRLRQLREAMQKMENEYQLSGFEVAQMISSKYCNNEVHIIKKPGKFVDHYNETRKVIKLSPEVFDGTDLYAGTISLYHALETHKTKTKFLKMHQFCSFIILASYALILIGAFLNNSSIIHFGLITFIVGYFLETYILLTNENEDLNELETFIKKKKLIKPFEANYNLYIFHKLAMLPISFLNYFK